MNLKEIPLGKFKVGLRFWNRERTSQGTLNFDVDLQTWIINWDHNTISVIQLNNDDMWFELPDLETVESREVIMA